MADVVDSGSGVDSTAAPDNAPSAVRSARPGEQRRSKQDRPARADDRGQSNRAARQERSGREGRSGRPNPSGRAARAGKDPASRTHRSVRRENDRRGLHIHKESEPRPLGFGHPLRRIGAAALDGGLVFVPASILSGPEKGLLSLIGAYVIVGAVYEIVTMVAFGKTLGKFWCGVRVSADPLRWRRPNVLQATARYFFKCGGPLWLLSLAVTFLLGYYDLAGLPELGVGMVIWIFRLLALSTPLFLAVMIFRAPGHRGLHGRWARTYVVQRARELFVPKQRATAAK